MRIVLGYPLEDRHLAQIQQAAPDAELVNAGLERLAQELPDADILCGHVKVPVPWDEETAPMMKPAGKLSSVTVTLSASDGPSLLTAMVYS